MSRNKTWFRLVSLLLIACVLHSCIIRSHFVVPKETPPDFQGRYLRLIMDGSTQKDIYMTNLSLVNDHVSGIVKKLETKPNTNESQIITAYLKPQVVVPDSLPAVYALNISDVIKFEVYDVDLGKTVFLTTLTILGIAAVSFITVLIIVLLTKESCPFVYVYNGEDFEFTGEVYGGAIFPKLERDDWLALPTLKAKDGMYQLKLANQAEEIQHTNLAELWVADHLVGTELLLDSQGKYHTIRSPQAPLTAFSSLDDDVLPLLRDKDNVKYVGDNTLDTQRSTDAVLLSFSKPAQAKEAKLVLRARNSIWLDYTMGRMLDLFGGDYDAWYAFQSSTGGFDTTWPARQGIPLAVYIKNGEDWSYLDSYPVVGPMADRDLVLPLDISGIQSDKVELKLECGARFWELDYVALDCSAQENVYSKVVALSSAVDQDGKNVKQSLINTDKKYFTQPRVGDTALLQYPAPPQKEGWSRTVFLHSRGHYKIIRHATGKPDREHLARLRETGNFGRFSREQLLELKAAYSR